MNEDRVTHRMLLLAAAMCIIGVVTSFAIISITQDIFGGILLMFFLAMFHVISDMIDTIEEAEL